MDLQTDWEIGVHLRRASWLMHAAQVKFKAARLAEALRAYAKYNPSQPRVPRGNPDGGQWTDAAGGVGGSSGSNTLAGGDDDDLLSAMPEVPEERPASARIRHAIVKHLVAFGAELLLEQVAGEPAGLILGAVHAAWLVQEYGPYVTAYFDGPKTLEELQQAAQFPQRGYDLHHIVEQTPAEKDGFSRSLIDSPENIVRIPTLKHWQVTGWFAGNNKGFGGGTPRAYLRGKNWDERVKVGLKAMTEFGILKP